MSADVLVADLEGVGRSARGGVLALGAFALIASAFMPVSLLPPIAADLRSSEGMAGQASPSPERLPRSPACACRRSPGGSIASSCCRH